MMGPREKTCHPIGDRNGSRGPASICDHTFCAMSPGGIASDVAHVSRRPDLCQRRNSLAIVLLSYAGRFRALFLILNKHLRDTAVFGDVVHVLARFVSCGNSSSLGDIASFRESRRTSKAYVAVWDEEGRLLRVIKGAEILFCGGATFCALRGIDTIFAVRCCF